MWDGARAPANARTAASGPSSRPFSRPKAATCTSRQTTKASYPKTSHQASVFSRRPSPSEKLARPSPQRNSHCRRRPCPRVKEATKKRGSRKRHLSRPSPRRPSVRRLRARPWRRLGRRHRPTDVLRTSPAPPPESNSVRKTAVSARRPMAGRSKERTRLVSI